MAGQGLSQGELGVGDAAIGEVRPTGGGGALQDGSSGEIEGRTQAKRAVESGGGCSGGPSRRRRAASRAARRVARARGAGEGLSLLSPLLLCTSTRPFHSSFSDGAAHRHAQRERGI